MTARRAVATAVVCLTAVLTHLAAQAGMLLTRPDWAPSSFRGFFAYDQLSYMSFVVNAGQGQSTAVEPFTETGANYYPHLYYLLIGRLGGFLDLHPATSWQAFGLLLQCVMVLALALALMALGGRPWVGLLAPAPFVLGTFSVLRDGEWYTQLASHAVLWGPFGVLFPLNGNAAALSIAAMAGAVLLRVWLLPTRPRVRMAGSVGAALAIGALANVQTYSFIAALYLSVFIVATAALVHWRARWHGVASVVLLLSLFLVGPVVNDTAGQLPTLVAGLVPALPGLLLLIRRTGMLVLLPLAAAVAAALPQVLLTAGGLASGDPFLSYRVASNRDLGVEPSVGLLSALPVMLPLLLLLVAGVRRRQPLEVAVPAGGLVAWTLLASNDRWGANAEPYRLWIDSYLLLGVASLLLGVHVLRTWRSTGGPAAGRRARALPARRWPVTVAAVGVAAVAATSALDWVAFTRADRFHQMLPVATGADATRAQVADRLDTSDGGLLATDPCIDPTVLKLNTGLPIAFFNEGMAWPARHEAVRRHLAARTAGELDLGALRDADARWLLTDSSCATQWPTRYASVLEPVAAQEYTTDAGRTHQVELWRLATA